MPRLPSIISKDQVDTRHHPVVDTILERRSAIQGPFTMLLHCPPLAGRLAPLGAYVRFDATLDKRVRVLAALTVAREFDVVYVWGAQTGEAGKLGIPEATVAAIRDKSYTGLTPEDAQIVDFTCELIRRHRVSEGTMKALRARFGEFQLIELTGTIGYYSMLAMTANACEIDAPEGAEVLVPSAHP